MLSHQGQDTRINRIIKVSHGPRAYPERLSFPVAPGGAHMTANTTLSALPGVTMVETVADPRALYTCCCLLPKFFST